MGVATYVCGCVFLVGATAINCAPLIISYLATDGEMDPYSTDFQDRVRDWLGLPYKHIVDKKLTAARNMAFDDMIRIAVSLFLSISTLLILGLYGMYEASSAGVSKSIRQASVKEQAVLHMETLHKENRLNQNRWQVASSESKMQEALAREREMDRLAAEDGFTKSPQATFEID